MSCAESFSARNYGHRDGLLGFLLHAGRALQCGPALKRRFVLMKEDLVLYCTPSPGGWAVLCVSFCIWKVKGQWAAGWRMWKDRIGCSSFRKAEAMVTSGVGDMQTLISFMTGVQVGHNNWTLEFVSNRKGPFLWGRSSLSKHSFPGKFCSI